MTSLKRKEQCLFEATKLLMYKLAYSRPLYITVNFIRSLHKEIYQYYRPAAGNFRTPVYGAMVMSKSFKPVAPHLIGLKLLALTWFINSSKIKAAKYKGFSKKTGGYWALDKKTKKFIYALYCATYVHHQITIIHPFTGGNGRLARLLMSMELANHGLYGPTFPPLLNAAILEYRTEYLDALEVADGGDLSAFVMFLAEMLSYSIKNEKKLMGSLMKQLGRS